MGIILCGKHGRSGISGVCPHIQDNVRRGVKTTFSYVLETRFENGMDLLSWRICQTCLDEFRDLGLPENNVLQGDDDFLESWQEIIDKRGLMKSIVCSKCLAENLAMEVVG
jgi:hypothetical protein